MVRAGLMACSTERMHALVDGGVYLIGVHRPHATVTVDVRSGLLGTRKKLQKVYLGSIDIKRDLILYGELYLEGRSTSTTWCPAERGEEDAGTVARRTGTGGDDTTEIVSIGRLRECSGADPGRRREACPAQLCSVTALWKPDTHRSTNSPPATQPAEPVRRLAVPTPTPASD
jgi:hypothetical protein